MHAWAGGLGAALLSLAASAECPEKSEAAESPPPPPAFGLGAQTEFLGSIAGVSALIVAWDGNWYQAEGSFGLSITSASDPDIWNLGVRLYAPIHRTASADFSLGLGGGVSLLRGTGQDVEVAPAGLAGARVRIFVVPNAAITGTIGAALLVRRDSTTFAMGARPLGSAGFTYYFR